MLSVVAACMSVCYFINARHRLVSTYAAWFLGWWVLFGQFDWGGVRAWSSKRLCGRWTGSSSLRQHGSQRALLQLGVVCCFANITAQAVTLAKACSYTAGPVFLVCLAVLCLVLCHGGTSYALGFGAWGWQCLPDRWLIDWLT